MALKFEKFRVKVIVTALIAGLLILVANSAIWANRYLVNTDNFTRTAVTSITSESSTEALASEIVDTALADYPVAKNVVGDTATNFISGLLGSDRMERAMTAVVSRLQVVLTSPQKPPIIINLEGAKSTVEQLISLSGREDQTRFDVNKIPDQITLLDPSKLPNFYNFTVAMTWISPLAALAAIGLLVWPYVSDRKRFRETMLVQGGALVLAGIFGLLIGPLFRPIALGSVTSVNLRVVVGNLYDDFIATFNAQTMYILVIGLTVLAACVGMVLYDHYKLSTKAQNSKSVKTKK